MAFAAFGGNHHHRNSLRDFHGGELLHEFEAIHDRHVDIAEDEVDFVFLHGCEGFNPVPRLEDLRNAEAWRSDRSTIFRITEESSTMSAHMLSIPAVLSKIPSKASQFRNLPALCTHP